MIPNVEAFIVCWNEEQMIRHTLNHYSTFCSKITLLDNYSTDDTIAIAQQRFPAVEVVKFDTNNEHRDDVLLSVKNNCWKNSSADYVIVCDTDEFLYAEDMIGKLEKLCQYQVALPLVMGFNMGAAEFPGNFEIPIYQQVKTGVRERQFDKQIIFNPKVVEEINYEMGCHECRPVLNKEKIMDMAVEFKLLHYKFLGRDYLSKKHEAYANRLSLFNLRTAIGSHYLDKSHIDKCFSQLDKHIYKVI
jgi:glycosyltransferase involved in cell wall biosynthesis